MSNSELPGFEIIKKIGKGGMSEVWKARQISLDRVVAIKVLTHQSIPDEEARARFHDEAKAAALVNHPGIVQVYDAGEKNGVPYYVMEYVEGKSVGDLLQEHRHLPEENALIIAECVALAMNHAWKSSSIVHCDIKPDNLLVAHDGTIKIADLGLARIMGPRSSGADSDIVLGTPNYTAPEQAQGAADLDCRADIYSLGATLYQMASGTMPFSGSKGSSAMDLQITSFIADPLELRPELHPATAWLIEKMMIKDRNLRQQNWDEVLADIKAVEKGRMPSAPYPEPGQSTVRRCAAREPPLAAPSLLQKRKVVTREETTRKKLVVSKEALADAVVPAAERASISRALVTLGFLALVNIGVYGYVFSPLLPSPVPMLPPPEESQPPSAERLSTEESRQILQRADRVESREETGSSESPTEPTQAGEPVKWNDPEFARGANLYNSALADYTAFQKTRADRASLTKIEQECRQAIRIFEQCRARAPEGLAMEPFITDCYHLISDVRHSTQMGK